MRKIRAGSLLFLLLFPAFLFAGIQSSLAEFEARIPKISSQIPQIIKSAEFAAGCVLKNLIHLSMSHIMNRNPSVKR